ncbi:MAG: PEP/pyruvate-binding domain-containing protein [Caldilineaceae bacterium]
MTMLVVDLQPQLESAMVGAKAANLGKAMANGIKVPPGFVVTRNALRLFLEHAGLKPRVEAFVSQGMIAENVNDAAEFAELCRQILAAPLPDPLTIAVAEMAEPLLAKAPGGVAVRSSGVHEDSATASFAGIYESYLGIRSIEELWVAIKQCWCSAWSPQASAYAKRMGITPDATSMAVLIQQLVVADSAGVLFTANPRTGNPWHFILESTFGLAQELVGSLGDVAADRFVLEWHTGQILERQIVQKPTACVPGEAGVHLVPLPEERRLAPSLANALATRLATLALEIDRIFNCRVDIEWTVADDEIQIVQVRPITALPTFFPHHLPPNEAEKTWEPIWPYWYFPLGGFEREVIAPLYRDLSYVEMFGRYQIGPLDLYQYRFAGVEADFNGHRYRAVDPRWPHVKASPEQLEAYLREYEPALRQMWLDAKQRKFPALSAKVAEYLGHAHSVKAQIEALLWARDAEFDLTCLTIGPPQCLFGVCIDLLAGFLAEHLPGLNADSLWHGHHPDLEPYYPHVQVQEAEALVAAIGEGEIRRAFAELDGQSLFQYLIEHAASAPFVRAYDAYCERFGLVPLNRHDEIFPAEKVIHYSVIQIIQDAFFGKSAGVAANHEQAMRRRQAGEAEFRQALAQKDPDLLPRFEQMLDWVSFWAPVLNDRAWASVPEKQFHGLWTAMSRKLQAAGLVETPTDMRYFTCEDLAYIAQTGDIGEGRRIWQRRRLEYEHDDRLQAPLYLGKAPDNAANANSSTNESTAKEEMALLTDGSKAVIQGRGHSPGQAKGIAHKIATLDESSTVTDQHILILTQTIKPTSQYSALLLALILRVRGIIIVQAGETYTHHIAQIARECGVPVLEISPSAIDHIPDSAGLVVDGSAGSVTLVT